MLSGYLEQFLFGFVRFFETGKINRAEGAVSMSERKEWRIEDKKNAWLAALPIILFGFSITLTWWIIGGPWYEATESTLKVALFAGLAVGALVALGGFAAIIKRFPDWGFTWLGADVLGFLLLIKGAAEDGHLPISDTVGMVIMLAAMFFTAFQFIIASLRSWQVAGLISIGMSTAMVMANVHMMAIGPYHRVDLAVLGLILGMVFSALTYFYCRWKPKAQIVLLVIIGVLNISVTWLANTIWADHLEKMLKASPFLPMVLILVLILLATPATEIIGRFLRKYLKRAE